MAYCIPFYMNGDPKFLEQHASCVSPRHSALMLLDIYRSESPIPCACQKIIPPTALLLETCTNLVLAAVSIGVLSGAGGGTLSGESQVLVDEELAGAGVGSGAQSETDDDDWEEFCSC